MTFVAYLFVIHLDLSDIKSAIQLNDCCMVFLKGFHFSVYFLSYGSLFTSYFQILYQHQFTLFLLLYTGTLPTTHFENDINLIVIKCYWFRLFSKGLLSVLLFYDHENLSAICTRLIQLWRFQKGFPCDIVSQYHYKIERKKVENFAYHIRQLVHCLNKAYGTLLLLLVNGIHRM